VASLLAIALFAANLGALNGLRIKALDDCDGPVTVKPSRRAWIGAVVEFSTRADARAAGDGRDG
jgi:hypothetical protein